jgi:hypothetical protein
VTEDYVYFVRMLQSTIARGEATLRQEIKSIRGLEEVRAAVRRWDAVNRDILRGWSGGIIFANEFDALLSAGPAFTGEIAQDSEALRSMIKDRINLLSSFQDRVDLWLQRSLELQPRMQGGKLKLFIVHGHDKEILFEAKDYFQNVLKFPTPVVLFQEPSLGRTVIEKFEDCSAGVDAAVVLLTADDFGGSKGGDVSPRARQNVIFELGFFVGKFGRKSGRVLVLYKGNLEIPSDLAGVVYLDVSGGIAAAGESIRAELGAIGTRVEVKVLGDHLQ